MGVLRLAICIGGVYSTFLLWAIAQERLSKPLPSTHPHSSSEPHLNKFPSALFLNFAQAIASCTSAIVYLVFGSWTDGTLQVKGLRGVLGIDQVVEPWTSRRKVTEEKNTKETNGTTKHNGQNGHTLPTTSTTSITSTLPFLLLQVSMFQTMAGPIGFSALRHISYPTMVLGKSCKLIPVLLLNVVLYRRKFSPHKYLVVALVTVGISMFMFFGPAKKKGGEDSTWGLSLLLVNLLIDGLTNSTQDQIFSRYPKFTGQQMMFAMSSFTVLLLLPTMLLPLPDHPVTYIVHLLPLTAGDRILPIAKFAPPALQSVISFVTSHPASLAPILAYALLGGLGQLFIFETIQHFGSLTLVMVTVTRKLFTMLLSVIVFNHRLTAGQWAGVGVVFGGIGVEAGMKRREMIKRTKRD